MPNIPNDVRYRKDGCFVDDYDVIKRHIYEIIDRVMARKDSYITVYFGDHGTTVNIYPVEEDEE